MSDDSKRLGSLTRQQAENGAQYRFLPAIDLPHNLPPGPVAIAEMANAFGVTHRTLHFYEEKGLISAGRIGPMRIYDHRHVLQMAVINTCREVGMPIAVIQELMDELQHAGSQEEADTIFRDALEIRKRELVAGLSTIHRQMQQVTILLDHEPADPAIATNDNHGGGFAEIERRCLELMAEGYTPLRLARVMGLSIEEVHALEAVIIRKFNANNRFQAVAKAVLLGIVRT